jgi:hypothetical protein
MKVYIATVGSYSDYHIERVFADKEQAEKYAELHNKRVNDMEIEEWDTVSVSIEPSFYIEVWCEGAEPLKAKIFYYAGVGDLEYTRIFEFGKNEIAVKLYRKVTQEEKDSNDGYLKYIKIAQDYLAKAKYMMEVEGMDIKEIKKQYGY